MLVRALELVPSLLSGRAALVSGRPCASRERRVLLRRHRKSRGRARRPTPARTRRGGLREATPGCSAGDNSNSWSRSQGRKFWATAHRDARGRANGPDRVGRKGGQLPVCATACRVGGRRHGPLGFRPAAPRRLPPPHRTVRAVLPHTAHRHRSPLAYAVVGFTVPLRRCTPRPVTHWCVKRVVQFQPRSPCLVLAKIASRWLT